MWYYELNGQKIGPVGVETIEGLISVGTINSITLVWREGQAEWQPLDETDLAVLLVDHLYASPSTITAPVPPPLPGYLPYPRVRADQLSGLFYWWIGLQGFVVFLALVAFIGVLSNFPLFSSATDTQISSAFLFGFGIVFFLFPVYFAAVVILYILHYKLWQVVQDGFASTTPGLAIGLLFIPYFSYYWIFRAQYELAKDLNRYLERHFSESQSGKLRKAHPNLALTNILASFVAYLVTMGYGLLFGPVQTQYSDSVATASQIELFFVHFAIVFAVIAAVLLILNVLTFRDFYLTAKNIIETEEKQ